MSNLLEASCRVAFAALIHDIGKFYQRTQLEKVNDSNVDLYCPYIEKEYRHTHQHAAFTGQAIDRIEKFFPPIRGEDVFPFKSVSDKDVDDSLINAAGKHHFPKTFLQCIITVADRLSSAFERQSYVEYNTTADSDNYISARLTSVFEEIDKESINQDDLKYRYPLEPLSVQSLFPVEKQDLSKEVAAQEYAELWNSFEKSLQTIPSAVQKNWSLWLDCFDSLWQTYTQAIPSASAFVTTKVVNKTIANVSLYDHSKSTAALAVALWRYYKEKNVEEPKKIIDSDLDSPFLIVQGDISGIQNFIFAQGAETQKNAAKILRGRSFLISLFSECAALKILETLDLPATSQIINAAGHFTIVAPNTADVVQKLQSVKSEIEDWFYDNLYGTTNIVLAWESATKTDFENKQFEELQERLRTNLEKAKLSQMDLCHNTHSPVFYDFIHHSGEICKFDGRFPAKDHSDKCSFCKDVINIGTSLTGKSFLIIGKKLDKPLNTDIFGYKVQLSDSVSDLQSADYSRVWDISLPKNNTDVLFKGYARRFISAYVPHNEYDEVLSFEDIIKLRTDTAKEEKQALMTLKGDIDNLGLLFQSGLKQKTFASYAGLSRRINAFFAVVLPAFCQEKYPLVYTVFAGGDDFFFIAPWMEQATFLKEIISQFKSYVCNQNITFSSGLVMTDTKTPIRIMAELTENELDKSKKLDGKNGVCCFGLPVKTEDFVQLLKSVELESDESLEKKTCQHALSSGYIYNLIELCEMAQQAEKKPRAAIWRSKLVYRTMRLKDTKQDGLSDDEILKDLSAFLGDKIDFYKENYKIALFLYLYKHRNH